MYVAICLPSSTVICILSHLSLKWCSLRHVALKKVATFMGVYKLWVIVQPLSLYSTSNDGQSDCPLVQKE